MASHMAHMSRAFSAAVRSGISSPASHKGDGASLAALRKEVKRQEHKSNKD